MYDLGFRSVHGLKGPDPEEMYLRHCARKGTVVDRCMLYVFRCAVYYASNEKHNPQTAEVVELERQEIIPRLYVKSAPGSRSRRKTYPPRVMSWVSYQLKAS
ncbi:MAG: helix-hairpin-helix domain-containing protein [Bacillota bacterium]